jgi:predicted nucleic acid-binding Zn ribbon protein
VGRGRWRRDDRTPGRKGLGRIVKRLALRPLSTVLDQVVRSAAPPTLLARAQALWPEIAGPVVAAAATPVSERESVVTVACESGVWAGELELLAPDLLTRLNARLGGEEPGPVSRLRFLIGSGPHRP